MQFDFNVTQATRIIMVFTILLAFFLVVPVYVLNAWVITKLWGWYVVPAFGLQPLRMIYAFGLSVLAGMFRTGYYGEDNRAPTLKIAAALSIPVAALLLGWIGTFFM